MGKTKVFALPNAGGTGKLFQQLKSVLLQNGIELFDLDYAHHGVRGKDPRYSSFSEMADDMAERILSETGEGEEIVLFGYSMGALVSYDILSRCWKDDPAVKIKHFFLAAHEPPHIEFTGAKFADCDEQEFIDGMCKMGGLDERLLHNPRFLKIYMDLIRDDYRLINDYKWNGEKATIAFPTTVFYSEEDTPHKNILQWRDYVKDESGFQTFAFDGGHFFIKSHVEEIAYHITNACQD